MKPFLEVYLGSIIIRPPGKRPRTIMLPQPLAREIGDLAAAKKYKELHPILEKVWTGATKSSLRLWYYPPETNPDIPEAERLS